MPQRHPLSASARALLEHRKNRPTTSKEWADQLKSGSALRGSLSFREAKAVDIMDDEGATGTGDMSQVAEDEPAGGDECTAALHAAYAAAMKGGDQATADKIHELLKELGGADAEDATAQESRRRRPFRPTGAA